MHDIATRDDVRSALDFVDFNVSRNEWAKIGMAIKNHFGELGFELFDGWSAGGETYNPKSTRDTWRSIRAFGSGATVTIATVFHLAKEGGYTPARTSLTEDRKRELQEAERVRKQQVEKAAKEEAAHVEKWHGVVADFANAVWCDLSDQGKSEYLKDKNVKAHGVRFPVRGMVISWNESEYLIQKISGSKAINDFFNTKTDETKFLYIKPGTIVICLLDENIAIKNLQFIFSKGGKSFLPGRKSGCYFPLAELHDHSPVLIGEGYSTCASAFEATHFATVAAFDCGNLKKVAGLIRSICPNSKLVILCDDDRDNKDGNPGVDSGTEAAKMVGGVVVVPQFDNEVCA
jgi:putative DNA primase/helicase